MSKLINLSGLLLSNCLILFLVLPSLAEREGRILGGKGITIDEAPYLVQIRSDDIIICAGTLVSQYYVISAAHCMNKNYTNLIVVGGATRIFLDPGTAQSNILDFAISDRYSNATNDRDVAVIKLEQPLVGANIKPIALGCDKWQVNDVVNIYGWGLRDDKSSIPSIQLQAAAVRIIDQSWCKGVYSQRRTITEFMFCAGAEGKDACSGDSGGPAIINGQFCGVISWGAGCGHAHSPGVYANLRKLYEFVQKTMKKLDKDKEENSKIFQFIKNILKIKQR